MAARQIESTEEDADVAGGRAQAPRRLPLGVAWRSSALNRNPSLSPTPGGRFTRINREVTVTKAFQVSLAPEKLWQAINPWTFYQQGAQFGLINVNLGQTPRPDIEEAVLDEVGSYGRQLGRIGDALEVILKHVKLEGLNKDEEDALTILGAQLAEIRKIKKRERAAGV
jgi:hypothetical protein